jgi:hypothetical protein
MSASLPGYVPRARRKRLQSEQSLVSDVVGKRHQRIGNLEKLTVSVPWNEYRRGAANLHLHFTVSRVGTQSEIGYFCAIWSKTKGELFQYFGPNSDDGPDVEYGTRYSDQTTVLIEIVEPTDDGEWIENGLVPAIVRLQLLNDCDHISRQLFQSGGESCPPLRIVDEEAPAAVGGPEITSLDRKTRTVFALGGSDGDNDVVQGGPKIKCELAHQGGYERVRLLEDSEDISPSVRLRVLLPRWPWNGNVRVAVGVQPDCRFDLLEVMLRQVEFDPPRIVHGDSL